MSQLISEAMCKSFIWATFALYSTIRINVLELLYEIQVYELNSRGTCSVLDYK